MATEPVDVLIIGAGASGAALAWSLAETRMRIVCFEQGDWMNPANYPTSGMDWEAKAMGDYGFSPNRRQSSADYPVNDDDSPIKIANFNGVGGGTVLYAGHYPRFHPSDFRVKSLDGVGDDWPIDYETLAPYYDENDRVMGVSGLEGDPAYPAEPHKASQMPPLPLGRAGETVARGFNAKGWHWWPSDSAIATEPYEGRDRCINLGGCLSGCAQGAKASTDITYWPEAIRAGVELRTRCRVREITVDDDGMANGVIYYDAGGVEQFQPAQVVVLASNGVGTPRILLNSTSNQFPDGLANRSGLVGRNLMFHPYASINGIFDTPSGRRPGTGRLPVEPGVLRDGPGPWLRSRLHLRDDPRPGCGDDRPHRHALRTHPLRPWPPRCLPATAQPDHRHGGDLRGSAGAAQQGDPGPGAQRSGRHSGTEDHLHPEPEQPRHAELFGGPGDRGARGGRGQRGDHGSAAGRRRLAPDGHRAHGHVTRKHQW